MNADVLVLVGHGSRLAEGEQQYRRFVAALRQRQPDLPIIDAALEFNDPPLLGALERCAAQGYRRVALQPLLLFGATHQKNDIPSAIAWARQALPQLTVGYGRPLGVDPALLAALDARIAAVDDGAVASAATAILLVGRGTSDPAANSEVAQLARLLWEGRAWGWVEVAYSGMTRPTVAEGVVRCARLGAQRVIVAPLLLFDGVLFRRSAAQAQQAAGELGLSCLVAEPLGAHPALLDLTLRRAAEVFAGRPAMNCDLCKYRVVLRGFEHEHGLAIHSDHHHGLRGLTPRLGGLPRDPADPAPGMPAAPMRWRDDGQVDWGSMWQSFCELALTGGPPVRGAWLSAPSATSEDSAYRRVADEIARGIHETTGLPVTDRSRPGWIGFRCHDERMAVWVAAAIIIENIAAQFDGCTVYVPVDATWRLKEEIKNVITAVAKTCHYWQEHRPRAPQE